VKGNIGYSGLKIISSSSHVICKFTQFLPIKVSYRGPILFSIFYFILFAIFHFSIGLWCQCLAWKFSSSHQFYSGICKSVLGCRYFCLNTVSVYALVLDYLLCWRHFLVGWVFCGLQFEPIRMFWNHCLCTNVRHCLFCNYESCIACSGRRMGADEPVKRTPFTSFSHSCRIVTASE